MPYLEPKSNYEPSRELLPETLEQMEMFPRPKSDPFPEVVTTAIMNQGLPPWERIPSPVQANEKPPGIIDLEVGSGIYKGYMFLLSPEQLHTIREICITAMIDNINALREKP